MRTRTQSWMGWEVTVDLGEVGEGGMNMIKTHCIKFSKN